MSEIIFLVEDAPEGGYVARSMNQSIYTEGDTVDEIKENIKDAILCHFEPNELPNVIRLHFVRDEIFAIS